MAATNFKWISLLPYTCNIYQRILESRLQATVKKKKDYGFKPKRGKKDQLPFALQLISGVEYPTTPGLYISG